ncbi:MAG TPA: IS110 family transposase [Anaerolineales bacterium]|nr:IS110 family transposase [Anaerolineales bacterium]
MAATREYEYSVLAPLLYLAFELGDSNWKLGLTIGMGQRPRERTIAARDLDGLQREIHLAKRRFELPETAPVLSCYEAGRDGFWLHRYLVEQGVQNLVVDSSSIEVNRRQRRAKTDRMDVSKLLGQLIRYRSGERKVWSVVRVPSPKDEDDRQLHRELSTLKKERTRQVNRIKGLLASQGVRLPVKADFAQRLESVRAWDGSPLLPRLQARLVREYERLEFVGKQIKQLERQRVQEIRQSADPKVEQVRALMRLNGIGVNSSWQFIMEFFGWREFHSGKEVGGLSGLAPTPYQSGSSYREQGMSKAGNRHVRAMAVEIAWGWLGYQPESELTKWYEKRFGQGSKRIRKIGIVALARRLLVELWRYLETGAIPEGAVQKTRLI